MSQSRTGPTTRFHPIALKLSLPANDASDPLQSRLAVLVVAGPRLLRTASVMIPSLIVVGMASVPIREEFVHWVVELWAGGQIQVSAVRREHASGCRHAGTENQLRSGVEPAV